MSALYYYILAIHLIYIDIPVIETKIHDKLN